MGTVVRHYCKAVPSLPCWCGPEDPEAGWGSPGKAGGMQVPVVTGWEPLDEPHLPRSPGGESVGSDLIQGGDSESQ